MTLAGAPAGCRAVAFEADGGANPVAATLRRGVWAAVVRIDRPWSGVLRARGRIGQRVWTHAEPVEVRLVDPSQGDVEWPVGGLGWRAPAGSMFEPGLVIARHGRSAATAELRPLGPATALEPASLPLNAAWSIAVAETAAAEIAARAALYRGEAGGWSRIGGARDMGGVWRAESRQLGRFAVFEDVLAPRIELRGASGSRAATPYSRWALEARLREDGSGIDAGGTRFLVDGAPVPSEWDAEERTLRWRPQRPPRPGVHRYVVVATDRAGNARQASGSFVID